MVVCEHGEWTEHETIVRERKMPRGRLNGPKSGAPKKTSVALTSSQLPRSPLSWHELFCAHTQQQSASKTERCVVAYLLRTHTVAQTQTQESTLFNRREANVILFVNSMARQEMSICWDNASERRADGGNGNGTADTPNNKLDKFLSAAAAAAAAPTTYGRSH